MGEYDPIVIAVSLGVSLLALGAVYIVAWMTRHQEERDAAVVEPEPERVLTEADDFELWERQIVGDEEYAARSEREERLLDPHRGWMA